MINTSSLLDPNSDSACGHGSRHTLKIQEGEYGVSSLELDAGQ